MTQSLTFSVAVRSDIGQGRSLNEDTAALIEVPTAQAAFVVCDGMGGLRAGDVASKEAVRVVDQTIRARFAGGQTPDPLDDLRVALERANTAVNALHGADVGPGNAPDEAPTEQAASVAGSPPSNALMGTTCVAGVVFGDTLYLAHAGDSRAYLYRAGKLEQLTHDHSYVADRVRAGDITEAEARVSRFRNMITRAIGIDAEVKPDLRREALRPSDTVLVCSDGLTTMIEDTQIAEILRANGGERAADRAATALVDAANKAGGSDNITVLLIRASGTGESGVPSTGAAPGRNRTSTVPRGGIVDMDAPRRRRGASPILLLFLGAALAIVGLSAVLAVVPGARHRAARLLLKAANDPADATPPPIVGSAGAGTAPDYRRLVYDAPKRFSDLLARGDILSYSRGGGLIFARGGTGTLMSLSRTAQPLNSRIAALEVVPSPTTVPSSHVFATSDPQGNVYVAYTKNRVIEKRSADGHVLQTIRGLDFPEAIAVDEDGNLYVVDFNLIKVLHAHLPAATTNKPGQSATPKPATKTHPASTASRG